MSEYTDNCKRIASLIKDRPWLFKKTPNLSIQEYIEYFARKTKDDFFIFPAMLPYKSEILDKYKNKVFNSMFIPLQPNNLAFHTLLQLDVEYHVYLLWSMSPDTKETVFYATIYTTKSENFRDFLVENESIIYNDERVTGFSQRLN